MSGQSREGRSGGAPLAADRWCDPPPVTIALLPRGTTPAELARIHRMGVGLMSAGIGGVSAAQTYLDIGQGARVPPALYDQPLPPPDAWVGGGGSPTRVPPRAWERVRRRARGVPADLVPGLLGSTLRTGGARVRIRVAGSALAIVADQGGRAAGGAGCPWGCCPRVGLVRVSLGHLAILAGGLRDDAMLIAIERPPAAEGEGLSIGIAGGGVAGTLTSDSTRMRGYVLSTDLAPTVLRQLGLAVPSQVNGEPVRGQGKVDPRLVQRLGDRLAVVGPRRGPVVGRSLLIWIALCTLAGIAFRRRGLRVTLSALAVAIAYLPALLLLTAALEPSQPAESLIVGVGSPALALLTLRAVPSFGALAIAAAVSVSGYAVDVIAGSHLTELSLAGPNPAGGVRFYGIGNELEASLGALIPIATGSALVAWNPRTSRRAAALSFVIAATFGVAVFAPGRFGADVGAAIGLPIGAAVAAGVCLGFGRRRLALLLLAVPIVALALLATADLVSGGNAHLTRTVLQAAGLDQLSEVVQRRLELSVHSFGDYARSWVLWLAAAAIVVGMVERRRIESWFAGRRWAWAGWLGAVATTVAGTLVNDSGALLLIVGTTVAAATVGLAWATRDGPPRRDST